MESGLYKQTHIKQLREKKITYCIKTILFSHAFKSLSMIYNSFVN